MSSNITKDENEALQELANKLLYINGERNVDVKSNHANIFNQQQFNQSTYNGKNGACSITSDDNNNNDSNHTLNTNTEHICRNDSSILNIDNNNINIDTIEYKNGAIINNNIGALSTNEENFEAIDSHDGYVNVDLSIDSNNTSKVFTNEQQQHQQQHYTPIQIRQLMARLYKIYDGDGKFIKNYFLKNTTITISTKSKENNQLYEYIIDSLFNDVISILNYRKVCDAINVDTFSKWFPNCNSNLLKWVNTDHDFIYNSHGIKLLINRYLRKNEPIQFCMLRLARLFANKLSQTKEQFDNLWILYYTLISCGFMQVSSILADADKADVTINEGEACRLMVVTKNYGREFIKQIENVCSITCLGVGVGLSVSTIPLNGRKENGTIHGGFYSVIKKLDACNYLSIYERKPKIAIYLSIHNNTLYEAFDIRHPAKEHLENIFVGVMINDYFMKCLREKKPWYLFSGDATLNGKYLSDYSGLEYEMLYKEFVEHKLYTVETTARDLMDKLLTCLAETGSPYVIWDDIVNRYSNHSHLGKIKTLNLCAEITNYASYEESSSCTLVSMNYGMCCDFPKIRTVLYDYLRKIDSFFNEKTLRYSNLSETQFAYMLGYMGTMALNNFMGKERKMREIGVSPMGVYDMALLYNKNPLEIIGEVSEAMYLGAIHSSCNFYRQYGVKCERYDKSHFSYGTTQWRLRNKPTYIEWPTATFELMKSGMANSMLTAQAPTATTSMLCGVTESVTLPLSLITSKESENGRNAFITYGIMSKILNHPNCDFILENDIDSQIQMYSNSAPFIDQSQSTMFNIELTKQNIFDLLKKTYLAELKTAIYYILPKLLNPTLSIIRSTNDSFENHYKQKNQEHLTSAITSKTYGTFPDTPSYESSMIAAPIDPLSNISNIDNDNTNDNNTDNNNTETNTSNNPIDDNYSPNVIINTAFDPICDMKNNDHSSYYNNVDNDDNIIINSMNIDGAHVIDDNQIICTIGKDKSYSMKVATNNAITTNINVDANNIQANSSNKCHDYNDLHKSTIPKNDELKFSNKRETRHSKVTTIMCDACTL